MSKRAVIYARVSRTTEESVSLDRQVSELRELAAHEGWDVVAEYTDDGLSGRREREKAEEALSLIAEGYADVLMTWELSRWSRMGLTAIAKLIDVLKARPGCLAVFKKEGLRSDQGTFGLIASVISEVASMEAQSTKERILSMRAHLLSQTEPGEQRWLGGRAPMGYRAVKRPGGAGKALAVDEHEAAHVREVARLITSGRSLSDATRYLNDAGVATPQSPARRARQAGQPTEGLDAGLWRITTVRKMIQSPTLVGRTTQKVPVGKREDGTTIVEARVVTDERGLPIQRWEPVLDAGTHADVTELFRTRGPNQARKAASWLSGQLFCDLCGSPLYANSRKGRGVDSFRCSNKAIPGHSCPGVSVSRKQAEEHMEEMILRAIGSLKEYRTETRVEGADTAGLDDVALAIEDVQRALAQDDADYGTLLPRLDALKGERRRLLARPGRKVVTHVPTGRTLTDAWQEGGVAERQFIISDMLDGIRVRRATEKGRASRIEDRLEPVWMEHPVGDD